MFDWFSACLTCLSYRILVIKLSNLSYLSSEMFDKPYILTYLAHLTCLTHTTCHTRSINKIAREMGHGHMVVLSKPFFQSPKQANKWIGVHMASLFWLSIAFLTWPNLTCSNRPLSPFFHPLTLLGHSLFCCLFSENWKIKIKRSGVQLLNFLLLALPN